MDECDSHSHMSLALVMVGVLGLMDQVLYQVVGSGCLLA